MAQKLWEKSVQVDRDVERFTVGKDREMDLYLAPFDILGSLAHISMLQSIGLLTAEELKQLTEELRNIYRDTETGKFLIEEGVEDVHSQVELLLTRKLGDIGKKIHSGRSRNDQVLVDLKLFTRSRLQNIVKKTKKLFDTLIAQSEEIQTSAHAGVHPFASRYALLFRTMVRRLCRKSGRRPHRHASRLPGVQPQSVRVGRRIRLFIPAESYANHR